MKGYTHITEDEQRRIERLLEGGHSLQAISRLLHRGVSTIADEVGRNSVKGKYLAWKAKGKARNRRKQSKIQTLKVVRDVKLRDFVEKKLPLHWSPELIAGRWKQVLKHKDGPSTKGIYKFAYSTYGRALERHLPSNTWKRRGGPKRKRPVSIDGRRMIDERPKKVEKRKEFGHFEADFIESGRDGKGSLLVLTERKTRYPFLVYTAKRDTGHINTLVAQTLKEVLVLSVTGDNDLSFQKHEELSKLLGADIFFCHPYSSSEKGTVENRNRQVRKYFPKGTDFSKVEEAKVMAVEHILRDRPMKCLGFLTPLEAWTAEMRKVENKKTISGMMGRGLIFNSMQKCSA